MMTSRVVLVEDHARLATLICQALATVGIAVDCFENVAHARQAIDVGDYAAMILDRGLPDGDGLDFLRELRLAGNPIPCVIVTARDAIHDRVDGLEGGSDDYVSKPFAMSELVARVRSLMRRPANITQLIASYGDVAINPQKQVLSAASAETRLSAAEFQVMLALVKASGATVRHAALEHAAWGIADAVTPNALEVTIHRLRKKLVLVASTVRIVNKRGSGFALAPSDGAQGLGDAFLPGGNP